MIANAIVITVSDFASDLICISCNKGHITPIEESPAYGRCSQCPTILLLDSCKLQVSALLTIVSNRFKIKLSAVDDKLAAIAGVPLNDINYTALLTAPVFTAVYNNSMHGYYRSFKVFHSCYMKPLRIEQLLNNF